MQGCEWRGVCVCVRSLCDGAFCFVCLCLSVCAEGWAPCLRRPPQQSSRDPLGPSLPSPSTSLPSPRRDRDDNATRSLSLPPRARRNTDERHKLRNWHDGRTNTRWKQRQHDDSERHTTMHTTVSRATTAAAHVGPQRPVDRHACIHTTPLLLALAHSFTSRLQQRGRLAPGCIATLPGELTVGPASDAVEGLHLRAAVPISNRDTQSLAHVCTFYSSHRRTRSAASTAPPPPSLS